MLNNYYDCNYLIQPYSYELLTGVTGALLFSSFSDQTLCTNYIEKEILDIVNEVVDRFSINQYTLVCQSNRLYLLSSNYIWVFAGDYHHSYECFLLGKHTVERVCSGLSPLRRDRLWC